MVMDQLRYARKLESLFLYDNYTKVKKEPTLKTVRKLSQILNNNKDYFALNRHRQLIQCYTKFPHMYGLPTIHKFTIPQRDIVSYMFSACHTQSRFLVDIINSLIGRPSPYVKDAKHLEKLIQLSPIHNNRMANVDRASLLTNVSTDEAPRKTKPIGIKPV